MAHVVLKTKNVTVTTAGTPVAVFSAPFTKIVALWLQPPSGNTGTVYFGPAAVVNGVATPPLGLGVVKGTTQAIDLHEHLLAVEDFYIDAANNGDKCAVSWLEIVS